MSSPGLSRTSHLGKVDNLGLDGTFADGSHWPSCWVNLLTELSPCILQEQTVRGVFLAAVPGLAGIWSLMEDRTGGIRSGVGPAGDLGLLVSPPGCFLVFFPLRDSTDWCFAYLLTGAAVRTIFIGVSPVLVGIRSKTAEGTVNTSIGPTGIPGTGGSLHAEELFSQTNSS